MRSKLNMTVGMKRQMSKQAKVSKRIKVSRRTHMAMSHLLGTSQNDPPKKKKNTLKKIPKSLLNLRFKAPQSRGALQDDRAYKKIRACKIWRFAVQYTSIYGQNTCFVFDLLCFCTYSGLHPSYLASLVLVNPSNLIFLIIRNIQNIYCIIICPENIISSNLFYLQKLDQKGRRTIHF